MSHTVLLPPTKVGPDLGLQGAMGAPGGAAEREMSAWGEMAPLPPLLSASAQQEQAQYYTEPAVGLERGERQNPLSWVNCTTLSMGKNSCACVCGCRLALVMAPPQQPSSWCVPCCRGCCWSWSYWDWCWSTGAGPGSAGTGAEWRQSQKMEGAEGGRWEHHGRGRYREVMEDEDPRKAG